MAIGQSTVVATQHVRANLFYRGLRFHRARPRGPGFLALVDNQMVDPPVLRRAEAILLRSGNRTTAR